MKKEALFVLIIAFASVIVYRQAFSIFFTQDDFILATEFSQNNLVQDIGNVFGPPRVTHWRPLHNLYFLIAGNLFDKNYLYYHLFTFLIHMGIVFLVFKVVDNITKNPKIAYISSFIYAVHPAHFVTLFWISGSATSIGFFFLLLSFYLYLQKKNLLSLVSFIISLLASEAMIAGAGLFIVHLFLTRDENIINRFTKKLFLIVAIFALIRLWLLTPKSTYDAYQIQIWPQILTNSKYYLLRTAGFAEASGDFVITMILFGMLLFLGIHIFKRLRIEKEFYIFLFGSFAILLGLFPFMLITNLSAHYMNISIFGFAILIGFSTSRYTPLKTLLILLTFLFVSYLNVRITAQNHWVVERSNLARKYIKEMEFANFAEGSRVIFNDNDISTSQEAYIVLGTGKAIDFLFEGKKYQYCFTEFESCEEK